MKKYTLQYYDWHEIEQMLLLRGISQKDIDDFKDGMYWSGGDSSYSTNLDIEEIENNAIQDILHKECNGDTYITIINEW